MLQALVISVTNSQQLLEAPHGTRMMRFVVSLSTAELGLLSVSTCSLNVLSIISLKWLNGQTHKAAYYL